MGTGGAGQGAGGAGGADAAGGGRDDGAEDGCGREHSVAEITAGPATRHAPENAQLTRRLREFEVLLLNV